MRVTIFGSGYIRLVTGACLADARNHMVCIDVDAAKVARLNAAQMPIHASLVMSRPGRHKVANVGANNARKRAAYC